MKPLYRMCVNCNLLVPVTDKFAEYLGVEKRKYLAYGNETNMFQLNFEKTSNALVNYKTLDFFKLVEPMITVSVEKDGFKITLYEGKIQILYPLPVRYRYNVDKYLELFDGELLWAEKPPVPPKLTNLSYVANSYRGGDRF